MTVTQCEQIWEARRRREGGPRWESLEWEERVAFVRQCRLVVDVLAVLAEEKESRECGEQFAPSRTESGTTRVLDDRPPEVPFLGGCECGAEVCDGHCGGARW